MAQTKNLSASHIKYLLTIIDLDKNGAGVRSVRVAESLGISKPSVHNMMKTFVEMGLIQKNSYGKAVFTRDGQLAAARYERYYGSVSDVLKKAMPEVCDVSQLALAALSILSDRELKSIGERVNDKDSIAN